jgi:hypothetical protein
MSTPGWTGMSATSVTSPGISELCDGEIKDIAGEKELYKQRSMHRNRCLCIELLICIVIDATA